MAEYGGFGGLTTGGKGKRTPKAPKPKPTYKPKTYAGSPTAVGGSKGYTPKRPKVKVTTSVSATTGAPLPSRSAPKVKVRRPPTPRQQARRQAKKQQLRRVLRKPLPGLDAEQQGVATTVLKTGLKRGATRKELQAAAETGLVESGFRNLPGGDADSQGWRQERSSLYPNPTNVKAAASRFFEETAAAGRGIGQTPGQLAQSVQRSALPDRYDRTKAQAKPVVKIFLKKAEAARKLGRNIPKPVPAPKKAPGAWAGSKRAVLSKLSGNARAEGRGDKRTLAENSVVGGAGDSDHLITNRRAYAADIPPDSREYARLRRELGLPPAKTGSDTVVKDGYRYQLIYGAEYDHGGHIHFGAEWVGAGAPEGTTLGGFGGVTTGSGQPGPTTTRGETQAAPRTARARKAITTKRRKRQRRQEETRRRVLSLIAEDPEPATVRFTPSRESYSTYVKRQPTKVRLAA